MEVTSGIAQVKQILSGDTLILCGQPKGGPPSEKRISFASVSAPRLGGSHTSSVEEESYAWKAREFTRKKLIGQSVSFKVEYEQNGRLYGFVKLQNELSFSYELVRSGLAMVKPLNANHAADHDELKKYENEAKKKRLNIWSGTEEKRIVTRASREDAVLKEFFNRFANKRLPAIVESVKDGGTMEILFTNEMLYCTLFLSGVQCDSFHDDARLSYAAEAKFFAEIRVLNRDVEVRLELLDNRGLYGTVYHPKGNMSSVLLSAGFAKIQERTVKVTEHPDELYEALKEAQKRRLRKWKNYEVRAPPTVNPSQVYMATVAEVISSSCYILSLEDGSKRRVFLASVRAPRFVERGAPYPWAFESFEFARKALIGRLVKVIIEFTEALPAAKGTPSKKLGVTGAKDGGEVFQHVQILYDKGSKNIAEELVRHGLARAINSKANDTVATNYEKLCELERAAKSESLGVHGPEKNASVYKVNDLTDVVHSKNSQIFLRELEAASPLEGVVRQIAQPNRFKIFLPSKGLILWFALSNIQCPRPQRPNAANSPNYKDTTESYGEEALMFARKTIMQRDVTISIDNCGKRGFSGTLLYKKNNNLAIDLLNLGYAFVNELLPKNSPYKVAEDKAKEELKGIWSSEGKIVNGNKEVVSQSLNETLNSVMVTHVNSLSDFYIQETEPADIEFITNELAAVDETDESLFVNTHPLKVGSMIIGKFSLDNLWYRAVVKHWFPNELCYDVQYIDFGNTEKLASVDIRKCPATIVSLPYQCRFCSLSGLLSSEDLEDEAAQYFHDITMDIVFNCLLEGRKDKVYSVVLVKASDTAEPSVNEQIVSAGLAYFEKASSTSIAASLVSAETTAKLAHVNIWRYGDIIEDMVNADEYGLV